MIMARVWKQSPKISSTPGSPARSVSDISENNLYAYVFGIKKPFVHAMGYFVSVLRQKIANFEAKQSPPAPDAPIVPRAAR